MLENIFLGKASRTMMPLGGASPVHGTTNLPQNNVQSSANITTTNSSNKSNNLVTTNLKKLKIKKLFFVF